MTAQEWLRQVRDADDEIQLLRRSMFDAWVLATRTTPGMDVVVQHSPNPHKFDVCAELDEAIYERIRDLSAMKAQAVRVIGHLSDPRQRQVLTAYFVDCRTSDGRKKTWEMVCVELSLSWRQLMYSRAAALRAVENFVIELHTPAVVECSQGDAGSVSLSRAQEVQLGQ